MSPDRAGHGPRERTPSLSARGLSTDHPAPIGIGEGGQLRSLTVSEIFMVSALQAFLGAPSPTASHPGTLPVLGPVAPPPGFLGLPVPQALASVTFGSSESQPSGSGRCSLPVRTSGSGLAPAALGVPRPELSLSTSGPGLPVGFSLPPPTSADIPLPVPVASASGRDVPVRQGSSSGAAPAAASHPRAAFFGCSGFLPSTLKGHPCW